MPAVAAASLNQGRSKGGRVGLDGFLQYNRKTHNFRILAVKEQRDRQRERGGQAPLRPQISIWIPLQNDNNNNNSHEIIFIISIVIIVIVFIRRKWQCNFSMWFLLLAPCGVWVWVCRVCVVCWRVSFANPSWFSVAFCGSLGIAYYKCFPTLASVSCQWGRLVCTARRHFQTPFQCFNSFLLKTLQAQPFFSMQHVFISARTL